MVRRFTRAAAVLASAGLASAGAVAAVAQPAAADGPCSTTSTIVISDESFHPPTVTRNQPSDLLTTFVNCTTQTQTGRVQWTANYIAPGGTCPVIDPLVRAATLPGGATGTMVVRYMVIAPCAATGLVVNVQVSQNGLVVAQSSATLVVQ